MKKYILSVVQSSGFMSFCLVLLLTVGLVSCSEKIDDSNYAISTEQTISDFVGTESDLTMIKAIFDRVKLGNSSLSSSITSVLAARGNYTVFTPNDDAVKAYLTKLNMTDVSQLSDEQAKLIAYSCIIDYGTSNAVESAEFPTDGGVFQYGDLNDRLITCELDSTGTYVVAKVAQVVSADNEVSNGYVHKVGAVIAPSTDDLPSLIQANSNMKIMGKLLSITGLADSLKSERDLAYEEDASLPETRAWTGVAYTDGTRNWPIPERRYLGYTGFVETDDVYANDWGISLDTSSTGEITNWSTVEQQIMAKLKEVYGSDANDDASYSTDYTSADNALNRFVAYHFLKGRMAYNKFVHHFCEYNYYFKTWNNPQTTYTVNVWDYFRTIPMGTDGRAGLMKIVQIPTGEMYINRISEYDNATVNGTYAELSCEANSPGQNGLNIRFYQNENSAVNGYYYPISNILLYNSKTREALGSERIRFDVTTLLPEMISGNFRGTGYKAFTNDYFENVVNPTDNTEIYYLQFSYNANYGWCDYQGDEFLFSGLFDFSIKLPPVPISGTYELRMGSSNNPLRGMCQIYLGSDPDNLQPVGLPFDLRQRAVNNPDIPWVSDESLNYDEEAIAQNDKDLRLHSYMKGPRYFHVSSATNDGAQIARDRSETNYLNIRRIVGTMYMDKNKTYYVRFKSALEKLDSQFFVDYFELVPASVYSNPAKAEDIW